MRYATSNEYDNGLQLGAFQLGVTGDARPVGDAILEKVVDTDAGLFCYVERDLDGDVVLYIAPEYLPAELKPAAPTMTIKPTYEHAYRYIVCAIVDGVVRTDQVLAASGRRARADRLTRNYSVPTVVVDTKFGTVLSPTSPTRR